MGKKVILAVAGAGKTYYICNMIDSNKKNLVLAYTHENIRNIKRELIACHGIVPELTTVMTFDSFLYRISLCPYEPTILRYFNRDGFERKGITMQDPIPQNLKNKNGKSFPNPKYIKKENFDHYVNKHGFYYCSTLSKLLMNVKEDRKPLIKRIACSVNMFYEQVLIDEFQDFRENNFDLVMALSKELNNVLLVGDYYQHSVSALNNSGKPFKAGKKEVLYDEFTQQLKDRKLVVDETTLNASRRCPSQVCKFVRNKLGINIYSNNNNQGSVIWVEEKIHDILKDDTITKLIYRESINYNFNSVNWSYSKGNTIDKVCVILTDKFDGLDSDTFSKKGITVATLNKLYVALTRTKSDLYIVKHKTFQSVKDDYYKV